ncbi:MAG: carbon-nitrogen hydrolase [Phycisphaeraceae bacterium]
MPQKAKTSSNTIRLGLIQHASPPDVPAAKNLKKAMDMMRDAASQGCTLLLTQELFTAHYFCQVEDAAMFALAQTIPGPTSEKLCALAKKLKVEIAASLFEKRTQGVFHNTTIVINAKGVIIGKYRKMHIPDDPRFYEKFYFTPGDAGAPAPGRPHPRGNAEAHAGWQVHQLANAKMGTLICWDQWYPEAARLTALRGAQILTYPTAIGYAHHIEPADEPARQAESWQTMMRSHAIANGVFVATINRIGVEGELTFWGQSFVADPGGRVIAQASPDQEEILAVDCDLSLIDKLRVNWPFLRDRRIDAYGDLTKRFID